MIAAMAVLFDVRSSVASPPDKVQDIPTYIRALQDAARTTGDQSRILDELDGIQTVVSNDGSVTPLDRRWIQALRIALLDEQSSQVASSPNSGPSREWIMSIPAFDRLAERVSASRSSRPRSFEPPEVKRRLRALLQRLHPSRYRGLNASPGESTPFRTSYSPGSGRVIQASVGGGVASSGSGGFGGISSVGAGGHLSGPGAGTGSSALTHTTGPNAPRTRPVDRRLQAAVPPTSTKPHQATHQATHQANTTPSRPSRTVIHPTPTPLTGAPPPVSPVMTPSRSPTVLIGNIKRPPTIEPVQPALPPPPPPSREGIGILGLLAMAVLLVVPVLALAAQRRRRPVAGPLLRQPQSKAAQDLIDPEHRALAPGRIHQIGIDFAVKEDWTRAMRYLFAALLSDLTRAGFPVRDFHTNRDIACLTGWGPRARESYWAATTLFEIFFYGERQPVENDYTLFQSLVGRCRESLGECDASSSRFGEFGGAS